MTPTFDPNDPHMMLASGKPFYFHQFTEDDIHLSDIFHSLARQTRFNGHTVRPYSIARHSCLVHDILAKRSWRFKGDARKRLALKAALLHDAAEAYIGDIITPLKKACYEAREIEGRILEVIREKYLDGAPIPKVVWRADRQALNLEFKWLFEEPVFDTQPFRILNVWRAVGAETDEQELKNRYLSLELTR